MEIDPDAAREMLADRDRLSGSLRAADTIRRNVYWVQAFVVPLCVAPFDFLGRSAAAVVCVLVTTSGLVLTFRELRRSRVVDRGAMVSYAVVIGAWSVLWVLLMTLVGPWLSDRLVIGWTLTGLIGTLPFLAGLAWERRR